MANIISNNNSVFNHFLAEIRDLSVQQDSMRFRRNMERIGEVIAYELSKHLNYATSSVTTPLGEAEVGLVADQLVIGTILRAGLPLHQGVYCSKFEVHQ